MDFLSIEGVKLTLLYLRNPFFIFVVEQGGEIHER